MTAGVPSISVLIPTYNRADLLRPCIAAILAQTVRPAQVLVVDDGSTDRTQDVLSSFGTEVQSLRVPQGGKSVAVNKGLQLVSGQYLWIFDDDDVAVPDALARLVEPLERDSAAGFSYGHYWITPIRDDGELGEPLRCSDVPDSGPRGALIPLLEFNYLSGAAVLARTCCYLELGGYDESLHRSQDYDFAIRLAARYRGAYAGTAPVFHQRQHAGPRGPRSERFSLHETKAKWLKYDQQIFRRLHGELSLEHYVWPRQSPIRVRTALLQRAAIMAHRDLFDLVWQDLEAVADGNDQEPLTDFERRLVARGFGKASYYGQGVRSDRMLLEAIEALARRSPAVGDVRRILSERIWYELKRDARRLAGSVAALRRREAAGTMRRMGNLLSQAAALSHARLSSSAVRRDGIGASNAD